MPRGKTGGGSGMTGSAERRKNKHVKGTKGWTARHPAHHATGPGIRFGLVLPPTSLRGGTAWFRGNTGQCLGRRRSQKSCTPSDRPSTELMCVCVCVCTCVRAHPHTWWGRGMKGNVMCQKQYPITNVTS